MNAKLLRLFNIKASEAWLVRNLFFVQLFQNIGIAMLLPMANVLFLAQFNVDELPKVYMLSALVLLVVNYIYTRMEHHFKMHQMILFILLLAAGSILTIRLLIYGVEYKYAPVVLLIWYQVIYLICGNSFWGFASLVFDVRESKRTFGILNAGDTPGKLLGYLSIPALASIGIKNFLFVSMACFLLSYLFMRNIIRSKKVELKEVSHKTSHQETLHASENPGPLEMIRSFFGNNLILLISVLAFIVVACLTVIDFTFLSEVKLKYHDDITLLAFLGYFFAIGRGFAILAKITLTSRIERRLGIKRSLLILPLLLIAFTIFILLSEQFGGSFTYYLYIFGSMALVMEVLKSILQDPLVLVLFQPLKPALRLKGHLISKGIMAPLGLFFAGLFIFVNIEMVGAMQIGRTCLLLLLMCCAWIIVVFLLDQQYITSLIESLKTGFFRGNFILKNDNAIKALLLEKVKSKKTLEVIYATDSLEKLDRKEFSDVLLQLLDHENEDVKKFALKKMKESKVMSGLPKIKALLLTNIPDDLKMECLVALSGLQEDQTTVLLEYLNHSHIEMRKEAMVALFTSGDLNAIIQAGQKLMEWLNSNAEEDRIHAAQIIGKVADKNFYTSLARLINDPSPEVQKHAIEAAGKIKNAKLIPLLLKKLNQPKMIRQTELALAACGEEVMDHFPPIEDIKRENRETAMHYVTVAMHVPGEKSKAFLEKLLLSNTSLRHEVILAMKEISYSVPIQLTEQLFAVLQNEVDTATFIMEYRNALSSAKNTLILTNALNAELKTSETSIFYLLSFLYDRQKFLRAYENIQSGRKENVANAIEVVDLGVSKKVCAKFIPVIEYLHLKDPAAEARLTPGYDVLDQIRMIIESATISYNSWTRAAAMYTMNIINAPETIKFLKNFNANGEYILEETRNFVLAKQP